MNDRDEIELSEAFKDLTAPRSTANYASRPPAAERHDGGSRWPQELASVLAVLVALAGAGTFLALRNARQNGVATQAGGSPAARSGAAMAYDSTAGTTVMYGGTGARGALLRDTWLWDGGSWSSPVHAGAPGPMAVAHMSDDPADSGVLLVGIPALAGAGGSGGGVTGCAVGASGTGSANPGTVTTGPPPAFTGAPGATGGAPSVVAPSMIPRPSTSPCPTVVMPAVQTWVFNAQGWHRVDAAAGAVLPSSNAQLAYDGASGDVIAVAAAYYPCGGPLAAGTATQPFIPCEQPLASGAPTASGTGHSGPAGSTAAPAVCTTNACPITGVPCRETSAPALPCGAGAGVSTWVWSGGRWSMRRTSVPASAVALAALSGSGGRRATLIVDTWSPLAPCLGPAVACRSLPAVTSPTLEVWTWNGAAWSPSAGGLGQGSGLSLLGSSATAVGTRMVAVGPDGSTRVLDLSSGAVTAGGSVTPRSGEAIAEGPNGTVVLFGGMGAVSSKTFGVTAESAAPGSDTWRWNGRWVHVAGTAPAVVTLPTACPGAGSTVNGCVIPPAGGSPGVSILPAPAATPTPTP
jgi:hypothetical protein